MHPEIRQVIKLLETTESGLRRLIHGFRTAYTMQQLECSGASLTVEFNRHGHELKVRCDNCRRQITIHPDSLRIG